MNPMLNPKIIRNAVRDEIRTIQIGRSSHTAGIGSAPIKIIAGSDMAPEVRGHPYLKTYFSNGRGFARTLYTPSTLRIVVGANWNPYDNDSH